MELGAHYKDLSKQSKLDFNYALDILVFLRIKRKNLPLKELLTTYDGDTSSPPSEDFLKKVDKAINDAISNRSGANYIWEEVV